MLAADPRAAAMRGMRWDSPRGPISIDPETRDIVQNEYMRRVETVNGQLYNVEFATIEAVKDPVKAARGRAGDRRRGRACAACRVNSVNTGANAAPGVP